ncbi:MAG: phosphomethylpyrimidine synthase ThiC, partial [Steroidobacteraceae bacterium]
MNAAVLLEVATKSFPASRKVYLRGSVYPDIRVPVREISLHPSAGEPPLAVYDSSGPYTDPAARIDITRGLPHLRADWIA